jgi:hypothetical protein
LFIEEIGSGVALCVSISWWSVCLNKNALASNEDKGILFSTFNFQLSTFNSALNRRRHKRRHHQRPFMNRR